MLVRTKIPELPKDCIPCFPDCRDDDEEGLESLGEISVEEKRSSDEGRTIRNLQTVKIFHSSHE